MYRLLRSVGWMAVAGAMALLVTAPSAPAALANTVPGSPGPCVSVIVPQSVILFNTGGDLTVKATVTNCSSDTTASQLIVIFRTIGGGSWCIFPESGGNPPNFTLDPGHIKDVACKGPSTRVGQNGVGEPATAEVYANCDSFSTQSFVGARNLDGTPFRDPSQGFTNSSCTLVATSNTFTVMANPSGR